ncbi:hypothetical protein Tco_0121735 [Tanacetum coccineum]
MENANPPPTNNHHVLPAALRARAVQELHALQVISAFVDSRLESIEQFLNNFANQPNETNMNNFESDDESVDTPLVSPFPHSDNDSDDGEVLNELCEYENAEVLRRQRIINSFDGNDLAFQCMIDFRKFTAYLNPFLPMNIISRKAYTTIMVEGLEGTGKNLVSIVRDVYVKFLIKNEEEIFTVRGDGVGIKSDGVASPAMLYLKRRRLEVLRKFHWMTLGGRSNQLSHVSSPLLRKPGEY